MRRMDDVTSLADIRGGIDVPVFGVEIALKEARGQLGADANKQFAELVNKAVDEAQEQVHTRNATETYVVIKIIR